MGNGTFAPLITFVLLCFVVSCVPSVVFGYANYLGLAVRGPSIVVHSLLFP